MSVIRDQTKYNIYVDPFDFEKPLKDKELLEYKFQVSFDHIITTFSDYFNKFMKYEHDDPEPLENYSGIELEIAKLGHPFLSDLIQINKKLYIRYVVEDFRVEHLEFVLNSKDLVDSKRFFRVHSLTEIKLRNEGVEISGIGHYFKPNPVWLTNQKMMRGK